MHQANDGPWKEVDLTPANMMGIADFLMDHQIEEENTFLTKYKKYLITEGMSIEAEIPIARTFSVTSSTPVSNNTIVSGNTPVSSSSPISSTTSSANTFPDLAVNTPVAEKIRTTNSKDSEHGQQVLRF